MNSKLRKILKELFYTGSGQPTGDGMGVEQAEKAICQAVAEDMLGLVGVDEPPSEYNKVAKAIRNKYRAELRQKIKEWSTLKGDTKDE